LSGKGVVLQIGGSAYDPTDPVGRLLFNVLALVAEFEGDLISARTREGMAVARAKGRLRGRLVRMHQTEERTVKELAEIFGIGRATVYRAIDRHNSRTQAGGGVAGASG
jgi:DNA invertase Pin-like site-specific DNA recombinase